MSRQDHIDPNLPPEERPALVPLRELLERERPVPSAAFRGELRRHLLGSRRGRASSPRWRLLAVSYVAFGLLCLVTAALGLTGAGPFVA